MHGIMLSFLEVVELLKVILIQLRKPLHLILIILLEEIYSLVEILMIRPRVEQIGVIKIKHFCVFTKEKDFQQLTFNEILMQQKVGIMQ